MPLSPGTSFGPYRVEALIGEGGMGQVYRATDTRLRRTIALKVLAPRRADDPEFDTRLEREARVLASLNHPNIGAIHGLEHAGGVTALVLEFIEGPTLAEIISGAGHLALGTGEARHPAPSAQRPVPVSSAIAIAHQISDALAAAHEKGVIHRDLKPANVKVTPANVVKVLDFGLAKSGPGRATHDATTYEATRAGVILGTTAYMSPEQTRGQPVDQRTDVWAFGCVLFELLSGTRPFARETSSDTIAAILERDPPWDRLPAGTPVAMRQLLRRCLDKDAGERLSDMREARRILHAAGAPRSRSARWGWIAAGLAGLFAIASFSYGRALLDSLGARPAPAPVLSPIRSVAVLPLTETSGRPDEGYFSNGLTDELIGALSKIRAWRVLSRTSVMQYKGTSKTLPVIAKELGVDALVEGSVQRSNDRVRITVRLVRTHPREENLWNDSYDRDIHEVLDVQTEVARAITGKIQMALTPTEAQRLAIRRPVDPGVLDLYLKGRAAAELGTEAEIMKGIRLFEDAAAKDSTFAPAHAAMALAYNSLNPAYRAPKEVMPLARRHAERAIELDATLSEAHTALAHVLFRYEWDWAGTEREARLAIDYNPSSADAHELYGNYLCAVGEQSRAIEELITARDLNPSALTIEASLLAAYVTGRQYDEAVREARRVLDGHPDFAFAHAWLGMAYMMQDKFDRSIPELKRAQELDNNVTTSHFLAIAQAAAGNRTEAQRLVKEIETAAATRYTCAYEIASAHVRLGQVDKAWEWLKRGEDEQCDCMPWLTVEPWMDKLRIDARYKDLVKRVGPPRK